MPYISADEVKAKRDEIKGAFPEYTFSIRCRHNSTIVVTLLEGPMELLTGKEHFDHVQVNTFHIDYNYADRPEVAALLNGIKAIAARGKRELVYDADYGSVPTFYVDINIGEWDRPYKVKVLPEKTIKARKARAKKAMAANKAKAEAKAKAAAEAEKARKAEAAKVRAAYLAREAAKEAEAKKAAEARAAKDAMMLAAIRAIIAGAVRAEA